jgi:hypothetical protein
VDREGHPAPEEEALTMTPEDRLVAHWAAQLVAAVGAALSPPAPDDSHTALAWDPERRALVGARGTALLLEELALVVGGERGSPRLDLDGRSREEALAWLGAAHGTGPLPPYPHPPPGDAPARFQARPAAQAELAGWFALAARALTGLAPAGAEPPLYVWPHHFDMAKLLELGGGRTIGAGLSPGDASYAEPYFYVTPGPYPAERKGPPLVIGRWHVDGWFGAVLVGAEIGLEERARVFVDAAISACRLLLS